MFTSRAIQNLAFTSRQLSGLLKKSNPDAALKELGEVCGPAYAPDIERLRMLLTSNQPAAPTLKRTPFLTLAKLIPEVEQSRVTSTRYYWPKF